MASLGLINLQTDLKSLRYGSDRPYVTKDINNPPSSNQTGMQITKRIDDLSRISQMLIDRPGLKFIANQALLQQVDIQDKLQKNLDNGNRTLGGAIVRQALDTVKQTAKIVGSTLAQVPVNGTGTHFVYAFRTDTYLRPSNEGDIPAFREFFGAGGVEGAPLALKGKLIEGEVQSNFGTKISPSEFRVTAQSALDYDEKINRPIVDENTKTLAEAGKPITIPGPQWETTAQPFELGRSNQLKEADQGDLKEYTPTPFTNTFAEGNTYDNKVTPSGSASIIKTTHSTITDVKGTPIELSKVVSNSGNIGNDGEQRYTLNSTYTGTSTKSNIGAALTGSTIPTNKLTGSYRPSDPNLASNTQTSYKPFDNPTLISNISEKNQTQGPTTDIVDFREKKGNSYSFNYNSPTINRERRVNLGNQGKVSFDRSNYSNTDVDTQDTLNKLNESTTRIDGTSDARDLAKLYFEIITPEGSTFLHFRAFIDSIDDNFNADWQGTKYVGRAENFYTYGGFERDINISFKIAAATRAEMKPLYRKMVFLASSTAPTYGGEGFMRGTLARLTVGSYFSQLPGVITSVKYSLIQDMPWEISMQNPEAGTDDDMQELPMGLQCSVSYKVIHDFAPQTGLYHYFTSPNPLNGSTSFLK